MTDHEYAVLASREVFRGAIFRVVSDEVSMPDGDRAWRDCVRTAGAAAVVALDADGRVVLVRQYRHAVRAYLWEIPAGLRDVPGESALTAARRELAEEVDLRAGRWDRLVDVHTTPGYSDELITIFLARDLIPVADGERHARIHEESDLTVRWVPLDEAVAMVLRGEITNGADSVGLLAAARARDLAWAPLRPA